MATPAVPVPALSTKIYFRDAKDMVDIQAYQQHRYQYATTSMAPNTMAPLMICYPQNDDEIKLLILHAQAHDVAIAVRSGGHHYSGKSSTDGNNIQVDMAAYNSITYDETTKLMRLGAAAQLNAIDTAMSNLNAFVPHGACATVAVGGHCQTGGYSCIPRAFGLFVDYIQSMEVITADCISRTITRTATDPDEQDLFWAVIGGSPGNFCIITHVSVALQFDADHPNSRAFGGAWWYTDALSLKLMNLFCEFSEELDALAADWDMSVLPVGNDLIKGRYAGWFAQTREQRLGDPHGSADANPRPAIILIYSSWSNLGGATQEFPAANSFFSKIQAAVGDAPMFTDFPHYDGSTHIPISQMLSSWVMPTHREFDLPYVRHNYITKSKILNFNKFGQWYAKRVALITAEGLTTPAPIPNLHISGQLTLMGGTDSRFRNHDDRTSCSWRDSTVDCGMDVFYDTTEGPTPLLAALNWSEENTWVAINSERGLFSLDDRRLLWAPWGNASLDEMHAAYYGPAATTYPRLLSIKKKVDPKNTFTPNLFSVNGVARYDPLGAPWSGDGVVFTDRYMDLLFPGHRQPPHVAYKETISAAATVNATN